ncbi:MAG: radical SAM protein [Ignavibacteriaceae bacterium]|jgi:radical SAM superfamily enzyme YgiQ (UPF0313 family)|nr:radical SAM protein [Ignavibacteriaceae bacterium]
MKNSNNCPDIVFISPSNKKLGLFRSFVPRSIPLGIGILSGFLLQNGYQVAILDEEIENITNKKIKKIIKKMKKPRIFGISSMTTNAGRAYQFAKIIKKLDKQAIVILGGIHPTVAPEEVLKVGNVDIVVQGEGEKSILKIMNMLKAGKQDFWSIPNIAYLDSQKKIVFSGNSEEPFDINLLEMFPYYLFDQNHYDLGFILASRGCPFDCIFCSQRVITKRRYRSRDNNHVIAELKYLINQKGQKNITFFDDFFTGDKKRVYLLCQMIREHGFEKKCSFGVQTRADSIDREILLEMKRSGFDSLMIGFEVSSNHLMKVINKGETVEDNINAIKLAKEIGFTTEATFIFGFPEETYAERINSLQIAKTVGVDRARFNNLAPYPGTKMYEIAKSQKRLHIEKNWENFSSAGAVTASIFKNYKVPYCSEGTNSKDLVGEVFFANLLFYLNIKNLKKLFNVRKKGSGKWFEIPKDKLLNPIIYIKLILLFINVTLRLIYFLLFSKECRRFFIDGFFKNKYI